MLALIVCVSMPAISAAAMRCGNQIINRGSSSVEVTAYCGPPAQIERIVSNVGGPTVVDGRVVGGSSEEVQVEIWTYNFGPNMLMERLRIENGIVVDVQSLGYGFNAP
jgi:Protein of unknown function (DUF2845)